MWRKAGVKVLHKSATIRHALKAQSVGVDLVEVVGYEASIAGGQPGDEVGSWVMLAKACEELTVPVVASGASATGRQLAAALAMGAQGITMATRFLCTEEAPIRREIKEHMASDSVDERCGCCVPLLLHGLEGGRREVWPPCAAAPAWLRVGFCCYAVAMLCFVVAFHSSPNQRLNSQMERVCIDGLVCVCVCVHAHLCACACWSACAYVWVDVPSPRTCANVTYLLSCACHAVRVCRSYRAAHPGRRQLSCRSCPTLPAYSGECQRCNACPCLPPVRRITHSATQCKRILCCS